MQGKLYMIMEICRSFDQIFKEHLDGMYVFAFFELFGMQFCSHDGLHFNHGIDGTCFLQTFWW